MLKILENANWWKTDFAMLNLINFIVMYYVCEILENKLLITLSDANGKKLNFSISH